MAYLGHWGLRDHVAGLLHLLSPPTLGNRHGRLAARGHPSASLMPGLLKNSSRWRYPQRLIRRPATPSWFASRKLRPTANRTNPLWSAEPARLPFHSRLRTI